MFCLYSGKVKRPDRLRHARSKPPTTAAAGALEALGESTMWRTEGSTESQAGETDGR
jgi:hypothetical protein